MKDNSNLVVFPNKHTIETAICIGCGCHFKRNSTQKWKLLCRTCWAFDHSYKFSKLFLRIADGMS